MGADLCWALGEGDLAKLTILLILGGGFSEVDHFSILGECRLNSLACPRNFPLQ